MPGPSSYPKGNRREYDELNEIVCDVHFNCNMKEVNKDGEVIKHDYITYREWLFRRRRLTTGKTV